MSNEGSNQEPFVLLQSPNQLPDYGNEQVFQRNRLPTRAYWIPETSLLLNGTWDFNYALSPREAPEPRDSSITGSEIASFASTPSSTPRGELDFNDSQPE